MKRSVFTKILSLMLCLCMCCSMPFVLPTVARDVPFGQTNVKTVDCDISVMSYNVLFGGDDTYAASSVRMPMAVDIVKRYNPDLIGFQEVTTSSANNWVSYLKNSTTGISSTYGLAVMQDSMTIVGSALIIAYRKSRFTLEDSGYTEFSNSGKQKRKFQWVKLTDKTNGKTIIMTNTHLSINSDNTANPTAQGGVDLRRSQAQQLKAFWESKAGANTVLFATGDYNTSLSNEGAYETTDAMETMTSGIYKMGAQIAHTADSFSHDYETFIDHVIVNSNVTDVVEHHRIMDTYGGVRPTDHRPMIIYANYTANTSFARGEYDSVAGTLTDTVNSAEYVIQPTVPDGFTYTIKDAANTVVGNNDAANVPLSSGENKYTVTVKAPNTSIPDTVINATITYNDPSLDPTVSATGALAAYYGKDEVHIALPQGTSSTTLSFSGGATYELYRNSACTLAQSLSITDFTATRATYYLKITSGNFSKTIPVKLYHPTTNTLPENTLFCDDNYQNLTSGKNAVWDDGTNVYVVPFSTRAFATVSTLTAYVNNKNLNGWTGYVASGEYAGEAASIKKDFSLYGANWDIDPLVRGTNAWTQNTARKAESIVYGYITAPAAVTVSIKGFSFISKTPSANAAIQLNSSADNTFTMQIENNIFDYVTVSAANSPIQGVGTLKKAGYIRDNIFRNNTIGRGITLRNITGLEISGNYFYNLDNAYALLSEISNGNNGDGNMDVSLIGNRFEECTSISTITTSTAVKGGKIVVRNNQYVSLDGTALPISLSQGSGNAVDFSKMAVTVTGNTFRNVNSGVYVSSNSAKVSTSTITIQNNSFSECISYALRLNCSDASGSITADARYNYLDSAKDPAAKMTLSANATANYTPYYTDAALTTLSSGTMPSVSGISVTGFSGTYDGTAHTVSVSGTKTGDTVLYSTDGYNYSTSAPTITNVGSLTVYVKVSRNAYNDWTGSATVTITTATFSGITVTGFDGNYDEKAHSVTVSGVPAGATLLYSTDGLTYTEAKPTFTAPGSYSVFVRVKKDNYKNFNASTTVTIYALANTDIKVVPFLGKADGENHNVTVLGTKAGDTVTYSVNGGAYVSEPTITAEGIYEVTVKVERAYYADTIISSRVTLIDADDGKIVSLITQSPELMREGTGFSTLWTMMIDPSTSFDFAGEDIRFTSYGLLYSNDVEALESYAVQGALGEIPTFDNVNRYVYDENEIRLSRIYQTYRFKVKNVGENRTRVAMAYIRFVYQGKTYEVYSAITDGSTLAGGLISGTGDTVENVDPF